MKQSHSSSPSLYSQPTRPFGTWNLELVWNLELGIWSFLAPPRFLPVAFILTLLAFAAPASALSRPAADKPNIIVVYTDDHGWPDIGSVGVYPDLKTPHIDALAASGVRATSGYSTAPQCVPSRAGLLTGKSQNRFGVESNGMSLAGFNAELTIAERLKRAGYATGQIGKWHLGPGPEITTHGFDDVFYKNSNRPGWANYDLEGKTVEGGPEKTGLYHLDACSQAAVAFIRRHSEKPFFLYLAYRAPHVPLDAPPKYLSRFPGKMPERRRQALAMIAAMDDGVGSIVRELKQRNLSKNTLIFFIADNGAPLKIHKLDAPGGGPGWDGSLNEPMNGEKGMLSEGGMRVPFVVSWPGTIPGRQVYNHPLITLDVAATAVEIAGLPKDAKLDGINLIPFLSGANKSAPQRALKWRWIAQSAIREGKWKLLRGGQREYLFDLDADKEEKHNLASKHPEITDRLRAQLENWAKDLSPPGLASKGMSETWEQYFDYYLDGKPKPPLRTKFRPGNSKNNNISPDDDDRVGDWIARNSSMGIKGSSLRVTQRSKGTSTPFIACSRLKVQGPATATVRLRNAKGGKVGVSWRLEGQRDFGSNQTAQAAAKASTEWQDVEIPIDAKSRIIHIRLHLPAGETDIKSIKITDAKGKIAKEWKFGGH